MYGKTPAVCSRTRCMYVRLMYGKASAVSVFVCVGAGGRVRCFSKVVACLVPYCCNQCYYSHCYMTMLDPGRWQTGNQSANSCKDMTVCELGTYS